MSTQYDGAGTVALVTGASHGIGLDVARQLADQGQRVILTGRDEARAAQAASELARLSLPVTAMAVDVASDDSVAALVRRVTAEVGRLDVLINNAAVETNLFGAWRMAQAFLPLLTASPNGRLVNVASGAGSHGDLDFGLTTNGGATASYGISKAALNALTAKFAAELDGTGVLVNAVCPGLTATAPGMEAMGADRCPRARAAWCGPRPCPTTGRAAGSSGTASRCPGDGRATRHVLVYGR